MDHLILGIRTLALLCTLVGAVLVVQASRDQPLPFLRTWVVFVLLMALDLLSPVLFGYFKLNMAPPGYRSPIGLFVLADVGINFAATIGMVAALAETSRRLVGQRVPVAAWWAFALVAVAAAFLQGATLARGVELDFFFAQIGTGLAAWGVLFAVLLLLLFDARRLPPGPDRRATFTFGLFYLPGFAGLVLLDLILPSDRVRLYALTMLYLSLVPPVWLSHFFRPAWGRHDLLAGHPLILDRIAEAHDLTRREREILERLLQGKSGKELADELFISLSTVKNHTYNLYRKLGVGSRHQLYRLVLDEERTRNGRPA